MDQTLSSILGQWPISYSPAILLHILKTFWWRNVVPGIMGSVWFKARHCICVSDLYFMVHWFYHCRRLKLLLYIKKWRGSGYSGPLWAYLENWSTKLESSSKCLHYRLFKDSINLENCRFLDCLNNKFLFLKLLYSGDMYICKYLSLYTFFFFFFFFSLMHIICYLSFVIKFCSVLAAVKLGLDRDEYENVGFRSVATSRKL